MLITGGSSRIGAGTALALALAERGVASIVTFNANEAGARETVARIEEAGASATALPLDLALSLRSATRWRDRSPTRGRPIGSTSSSTMRG